MSDHKQYYRAFCLSEPGIPVFSQDWWLDAVCEGAKNWDVVLVERKGEIVASMPYYVVRKYGFIKFKQPPLTQNLGPWLRPSDARNAKVLAEQKDLMQALIDQLPVFDHFEQNWSHLNSNWLPFYWRGFHQTTRYTYILPDLTDESSLWAGFSTNIRTDIRKAENRFKLKVRDDLGLDIFLRLNKMTFSRQGKSLPYTEAFVHRLDAACNEHHCRKIWIAEDSEGHYHAGVYVVWDENSAYCLMIGGDPELRSSGATSLCMWHAIRHAATVTKRFDFEGSMIEPVERFFRAFGSAQTPYFSISKTPSRILRLRYAVKSIIKRS